LEADVTKSTVTTGSDNYYATIITPNANTGTWGANDILSDGGGTDTLWLTVTGANGTGGTAEAATVSGIETVNVRGLMTTAADIITVNATNFSGTTSINADRATSAVTVTNLATGASGGIIGNGVVTGGAYNFGYKTASDAAVLNISKGVNAGAVAVTSNTTGLTINSTGGAQAAADGQVNTIGAVTISGGSVVTAATINAATSLTVTSLSNNFTAATTDKLTVTGAATLVTLGTLPATLDIVDASGMTAGGVSLTIGNLASKITGGAGKDTITTAGVQTGAVNAGGGTTDTLVVAAAADIGATPAAQFTNFEVLRNNAGGATLDVSTVAGITAIELSATGQGATKMNATQAAAVTAQVTNATFTLALATDTGTTDVLGLTLKNSTAATAVDATAATVSGFETLNVVSSSGSKAGGTGTGNDLAFAAAGDLKTIAVSGEYDLTIAAANVTSVATITSAQTGTAALYVSGNFAVGSSVTGSGGADAFILGNVGTSYSGGAGDDTMSATQAQLNTGAVYSAVSGGDGTDTLNLTGGGAITIVDNVLSKVTGFEKIVIATTGNNNQSIATGGFFDSGFKTAGVDLTTTTAKGTVTIDMTTFTGAATLSVTTVGTGAGEGTISVQTGSGADVITVSAATAGDAGSVSTFAGNDKITTAGTEAFSITGGAGNDTIALGSTGVNTIVFADTAALNGADTITSFDKAADIINWDKGGAETIVTGALTATANVMYALGGLTAGKADTAEAVATAVTAAATWTAAAATAWITISDDNSTAIYSWTDVAGTAGVQATEITLVGTIDVAMTSAEIQTATTI
jgi:hypothetical protein